MRRADAIAAIVAESGKSRQQVRRLIDAYEARGVAGLARKPRVDAGRAKWPISRAWQSLCDAHSIGAATRAEIVSKLEQFVRNNWRSDGPGWRIVAQDATFELMVLMRAAGVDLPGDKLRAACRVSRSFVERWRAYANPAIVGRDAKRVYDRHEPIVRRSRDGMLPMECIAGDVHPIDIRCRRDDGSVAHARMIAWVDAATWRAFVSLVLLEKGRGIRQEHVILSFVEMVEAWGLPAGLYLDNGGEYNWTRLVDDAMRLNAMAIEVAGDRSPTRRSLPYNGRSKLIETFFSSFEGLYLRRIHGWVGGDRMRAKTANVGKAPPVFEGGFEELNAAVGVALAAYHATPQRGHLAGRSPNEALKAHIDAGWAPTAIGRAELECVFAREIRRVVRNGVVSVYGQEFEHDALLDRSETSVRVRVPLIGDRSRIAVMLPDVPEGVVMAERRPVWGWNDPAGARHAAERKKSFRAAVAARRAETIQIDGVALMARTSALGPKSPAMPAPANTVTLGGERRAEATARARLPQQEVKERANRFLAIMRKYPIRRTGGDG